MATTTTTPEVDAARAAHIAALEAIISAGTLTSAPLRTQMQALDKQIRAEEGPEVAAARQELQSLKAMVRRTGPSK